MCFWTLKVTFANLHFPSFSIWKVDVKYFGLWQGGEIPDSEDGWSWSWGHWRNRYKPISWDVRTVSDPELYWISDYNSNGCSLLYCPLKLNYWAKMHGLDKKKNVISEFICSFFPSMWMALSYARSKAFEISVLEKQREKNNFLASLR